MQALNPHIRAVPAPNSHFSAFDDQAMRQALELAAAGAGRVEPNPQVGAVIAAAGGGAIIAAGCHERFGGPHAEVVALAAAGEAARGATLYVTLEPCCHHGKTPPCTESIVAAGIARVVVAASDPNPRVAGGGIAALRAAGISVDVGLCETEARRLTAPFRKLIATGTPWVIAKWAMSLDGRLMAPPGHDRWISSLESRSLVHDLRERVDAIAVGIGTARADDPLLTARPATGRAAIRQPLRIILDTHARLPLDSRLACTARESPVLVAVGPAADAARVAALGQAGCEVWRGPAHAPGGGFAELLRELGSRRVTNLLIEGGPTVLAALFASGQVDEAWAFIAPRVLGGAAPPSACVTVPATLPPLEVEEVSRPGGDILVRGIVRACR